MRQWRKAVGFSTSNVGTHVVTAGGSHRVSPRWWARWRHAATVAIGLLVAATSMAACSDGGASGEPAGQLATTPGTNPATRGDGAHGPLEGPTNGDDIGVAMMRSKPGEVSAYGSFYICARTADTVTIKDLEPVATTGALTVDRFGVASKPRASSSLSPGHPLTRLYKPAAGYQIEPSCAADRRYDVGIEVVRNGPGDASMDGIRVIYEAAGHTYTDQWPVHITLCDPTENDHQDQHCQ